MNKLIFYPTRIAFSIWCNLITKDYDDMSLWCFYSYLNYGYIAMNCDET